MTTLAIYEVSVEVNDSIVEAYLDWLKSHMADIVLEANFVDAELFRRDDAPAGKHIFVVHYLARSLEDVQAYIENLSAKYRADGLQRFGQGFRAERRILVLQEYVHDLTESTSESQIVPTYRKENSMNTQVNWQKIREEFNRLADVEALKAEVQRIGTEIRNFDYHTVLTPTAKQKVKAFEKRYATLMRTISQGQRQMDREFNRILREIKVRRTDVNKIVKEQKAKLERVSGEFKKRWANAPKRSAAGSNTTAQRTTKKSSTRKRTTKKA